MIPSTHTDDIPTTPFCEDELINLRPWSATSPLDFEAWKVLWQQEGAWELFFGEPSPKDGLIEAWFQAQAESLLSSGLQIFAIELNKNKEVVGACGVEVSKKRKSHLQLFCLIKKEVQKKGLATRSCKLLIAAVKEKYLAQKITASFPPKNKVAKEILQRLSFEYKDTSYAPNHKRVELFYELNLPLRPVETPAHAPTLTTPLAPTPTPEPTHPAPQLSLEAVVPTTASTPSRPPRHPPDKEPEEPASAAAAPTLSAREESPGNEAPQHILFYDGECGICQGFVSFFISKHCDKIYFAPLQGLTAQRLLSESHRSQLNSVIFWNSSVTLERSTAALSALSMLGGSYRILSTVLFWVPRPLRDFVYNLVAKHRHRIRRPSQLSCDSPPEELKKFFLE